MPVTISGMSGISAIRVTPMKYCKQHRTGSYCAQTWKKRSLSCSYCAAVHTGHRAGDIYLQLVHAESGKNRKLHKPEPRVLKCTFGSAQNTENQHHLAVPVVPPFTQEQKHNTLNQLKGGAGAVQVGHV